jgi:hypothetical protein
MLLRERENELLRQSDRAYAIGMLSPAVMFDKIVLRLARTDIHEYETFVDGVYRVFHAFRQKMVHQRSDGSRVVDVNLLREMPDFTYVSDSVSKRIQNILPEALVLFLYCTIFTSLSVFLFQRRDVR